MRTLYAIALSMTVGTAIGAAGSHAINAQANPPAYFVAETNVADPQGYSREYLPKAEEIIKAHGGSLVAAGGSAGGGEVVAVDGDPPKRIVIYRYPNMDVLQAWRNDPEYQQVQKIGEKFATYRSFAVEGRQ